ncbi:DUF4136 domain-containing protein [Sphingomonas xanthus]|uniref:DUF4136 domain-containing protein n=2 Tax=Sphingomonas xanthus TaxID=2594473 RepID=A0A516IUE1_9SPHN|nr:DUF4136 domain-containing protein [Sphingomonas xanthus]
MRINKLAAAVLLGVSALGLSACATGFPAKVSRYQAMPAPQGQSFVVVPYDARDIGGLEFARYADLVAQAMQAQGYARAASVDQATMVVQVGYGVGKGRTEYVRDPFPYGRLHDPFWNGFYGRPYYSRYRYWGPRSAFYYGWNDPFWYSPFGEPVRSYTSYQSELRVDIRRKVDNASLFEGKAQARSTTDNLGTLVPNLIEAMFTGFPGRSGETVRITVPPHRRTPS